MEQSFFRHTWAEVDLSRLKENLRILRSGLRPETKITAVVKADAYGHGVENTALLFEKCGVDGFAVSSFTEAAQLRSIGITRPVLILGYTPPEYAMELSGMNITQCVFSAEYAEALSECAVRAGCTLDAHIKIDTSMSRLGFDASDSGSVRQIQRVCSLDGINARGIFTHFASADFDGDPDKALTREDYRRFKGLIDELLRLGVRFEICHCCNSAASVHDSEMQLDMVREGILLYGLCPSKKAGVPDGVLPAMSLKSIVTMVKTVKKGRTVSYGRTYTAKKDTVVATVCIGYADGYPRLMSGRGEMLVKGKRAPIIGKVCMDQLMLDVTDIPGVSVSDEVTAFGDGLPVEEIAELCGTINYEIVCGVSKRVPRVYLMDGKTVSVADYIKPAPQN